jgi:DNA repair exonuclease SbcCD ATPase subunit
VPADTSELLTGLDPAAGALGAIENSHDEFENFFGDVFDQLQSLSLELFARHKCLELTARHQEEQQAETAQQQERFQQLIEELHQVRSAAQQSTQEHQQVRAEVRAVLEKGQEQQSAFRQIREELGRLGAEFHAGQDQRQRERAELRAMQETIEGHLARLAAITAELAEARTQSAAFGDDAERQRQLEQMLEDSRQQRTAWEHERAALEAELELVRDRAAELAETLADQKRQAAEHQASLASELKRMRSLLEAISGRMQAQSAPGPAPGKTATADADPVFDSVLAQFEILQRDISQRRLCKTK